MRSVRFSPSFVIAVLALVVAACGGAYAAVASSSSTISACVRHKGGAIYVATGARAAIGASPG